MGELAAVITRATGPSCDQSAKPANTRPTPAAPIAAIAIILLILSVIKARFRQPPATAHGQPQPRRATVGSGTPASAWVDDPGLCATVNHETVAVAIDHAAYVVEVLTHPRMPRRHARPLMPVHNHERAARELNRHRIAQLLDDVAFARPAISRQCRCCREQRLPAR